MGKVLTHTYILKEVWGSVQNSDIPSLRVFMATLRKKLERDPKGPKYIQTHVGVGYRMLRIEDQEEHLQDQYKREIKSGRYSIYKVMGYLPDFCMNTIFHIFIEREKRGKNRAFKKRSRKK